MAIKITTISLGDYNTQDRVDIDIRLNKDNGLFEAYLGNEGFHDTSLVDLRQKLKTKHRQMHTTTEWAEAYLINMKTYEVSKVFVTQIGRSIITNTTPARNGGEKNFTNVEQGYTYKLPMKSVNSWSGDLRLIAATPEIGEKLEQLRDEVRSAQMKLQTKLNVVRDQIEAMAELTAEVK